MEPVYEQLHQHLLERDIIHADETPCQVLKEEGKTAQSKSYMWLYGSGNDGLPPIRLYDYQPSRGGYHAEEFLKGFSGYLTCDGFGGYNKLKDVIRCGCLAHMRRYWQCAVGYNHPAASVKFVFLWTFDRPPLKVLRIHPLGSLYCFKRWLSTADCPYNSGGSIIRNGWLSVTD